jgi:histidine decarboxylase
VRLPDVIDSAVGPYPDNCGGFLNRGATGLGYITAVKLSLGDVDREALDEGLATIVSYDRASKTDSYFGQVNMVTATSFSGVNGAIWGYDLAKADELDNPRHLRATLNRHDGVPVPVWSMEPLLHATQRLFGTADKRRFNILPGEVVVSAARGTVANGPTEVWGALALAIAEDRGTDASLFIEDASDTAGGGEEPVEPIVLAEAILACGKNQGVLYKEIFVEVKEASVSPGHVGVALAAAPYITLAARAIPEGMPPSALMDMTITEWEQRMPLI